MEFPKHQIFRPDPNNPDQILIHLPKEVIEHLNIVRGNKVKVLIGDQGTIIIENVNED